VAHDARPPELDRETIVAAALEEIDRHGLGNFSLRSLAKSLGIFPTAVSWHVSDRSHLLAEVVRLVLEDISPPGFHSSWQSYLKQVFLAFSAQPCAGIPTARRPLRALVAERRRSSRFHRATARGASACRPEG